MSRHAHLQHASHRRGPREERDRQARDAALGEAGKLEAGEGETTQAIRRRLNTAAEALGKHLGFRRTADTVYFWSSDGRRRGRPRKNPVE